MTSERSLQQLSETAACGVPDASILTRLTRLFFDPPHLSWWHQRNHASQAYLDPETTSRHLDLLTPLLLATADDLIAGEGLEDDELYHHLIQAEARLSSASPLFCPERGNDKEKRGCLPFFAPMALVHLALLELLCALAKVWMANDLPTKKRRLKETASSYTAFAKEGIVQATRWRTAQLEVACTPLKQTLPGTPNLQVTLKDKFIGRTIVDEMCPAYPGRLNPLLQRTVDRISFYEERLHFKALLFWENQVLDILSVWNDQMSFEMPQPPNTVDDLLDDALYQVMQGLSGSMMKGF